MNLSGNARRETRLSGATLSTQNLFKPLTIAVFQPTTPKQRIAVVVAKQSQGPTQCRVSWMLVFVGGKCFALPDTEAIANGIGDETGAISAGHVLHDLWFIRHETGRNSTRSCPGQMT